METAPEHASERGGHAVQAEDDPRVGGDDEEDAGDGDVEQGQVHVGGYAHVYTRERTCAVCAHLFWTEQTKREKKIKTEIRSSRDFF